MKISYAQIRMAQAGLDLSSKELAEKTGLNKNTLTAINKKSAKVRASTLIFLKSFFESNGITFINDNGITINPLEK